MKKTTTFLITAILILSSGYFKHSFAGKGKFFLSASGGAVNTKYKLQKTDDQAKLDKLVK